MTSLKWQTENLQKCIQELSDTCLYSPFITLEGFRHINHIFRNRGDYIDVVHSLFNFLNLPISWILHIRHPYQPNNAIPFEIYISLITDQIKDIVFTALLNYVKQTKLKYVYVHCTTT
jgi:hypothetical protein